MGYFFSSALLKAWARSPLGFFFSLSYVGSSGFRLDDGCLSFWSLFPSSGREERILRLGGFRREVGGMDGGPDASFGVSLLH